MKTIILILLIILITPCIPLSLRGNVLLAQKKPFTYLPPGTTITIKGVTTSLPDGGYLTNDGVVTAYLHDMNELDYLDSVKIEYERQLKDDKGEISALDSSKKEVYGQLNRCIESNKGKDALIKQLMEPVKLPFIVWDGFYLNIGTAYSFDIQTIQNQILKTLKYFISVDFAFKVLDRFRLAIEPILPIGDKFKLQAKVGYKIF